MKIINLRSWLWQYGLPLVIFVGSVVLMLLLMELTGDDLDFLWYFGVFPLLAFLYGLLWRPPHAWVVPAIVVAGWLTVALWSMYVLDRGPSQKPDPTQLVVIFVLLVGLPMTALTCFGRWLRQ